MKRGFTLLSSVFAIVVLGLTAGSAYAIELPSFLYLAGETGETELAGESSTAKITVNGIRNVEGVGWLISNWAVSQNMSGLGKLNILFTKMKLGTTNCNTEGDAAGTELLDGLEWHLVPLLGGGWAVLILIPTERVLICPPLKIKHKGSLLWKATTPLSTENFTSGHFEFETGKCGGTNNRTPAFTEFASDTGMGRAKLESSVGLGFEESCLEIEGSIKLTPSRMMEVM